VRIYWLHHIRERVGGKGNKENGDWKAVLDPTRGYLTAVPSLRAFRHPPGNTQNPCST
jgi:hypothetical protein